MPNIGDGDTPLSTGLENIEQIYDKCLQSLYEVKHTILDPSDSSWNDNYQKFRLGVNETENLVEKVLNEAFETVTSVKEGVEILDVFHQYTPRQRIRQVYEGKKSANHSPMLKMETKKEKIWSRGELCYAKLEILDPACFEKRCRTRNHLQKRCQFQQVPT